MRWTCCFALPLLLVGSTAWAEVVDVSDAAGLSAAVAAAKPGDVITLAAGTYQLPSKTSCQANGT